MKLKDIFFFEKMLTPKLIIFSYWIVLMASFLLAGLGIVKMIQGDLNNSMIGLLYSVTGLLVARTSFESVMALFRIHSVIKRLEKKLNLSELDEQV